MIDEFFDDPVKPDKNGKVKSKSRRRYRSISRTGINVRLFNGSKMHIEKTVKELRFTDPNFATEAAAVRHYVSVGIAAETATSDLRNSIDNNIIKSSIKKATRKELDPLESNIKILQKKIEIFEEEMKSSFNNLNNRTVRIESKLDVGHQTISELIENVQMSSDEILRNEIIIRCILYVFLIGLKTGRVAAGNENTNIWRKIVFLAHDKVNQLSLVEIRKFKNNEMDRNLIHAITKDILMEVDKNKAHVKFDFPPPLDNRQNNAG